MEFTQNDWGQRDIINRIKILTKRGTATMHAFIPTKYQKYPLTTILKHANVLAQVNRSHWGRLYNMTPHDAYSITIHILAVTLADNSHKQKDQNPGI